MHLLYLDESGNDPRLPWFVLAGVSVPERQTHWIEQDLNQIASRFNRDAAYEVELHGSPMHTGNGIWRRVERAQRVQAICDSLASGVRDRQRYGVRLFAAAIKREHVPTGKQPIDVAFEQLCSRFDQMLSRLNRLPSRSRFPEERGLILFDKAANELTIQSVAREFKYEGHQWGRTRNYAEVPVFLDSESSRLIQLVDLVAYAVYQHFAHAQSTYFQIINRCFDNDGLREHGLFTLP